MGVFTAVCKYQRSNRIIYSVEFTGAAGSISGIKGKSEVNVTRAGLGLYTFAVFAGPNFTVPAKFGRLAYVHPTFLLPAAATDGGWAWVLSADNMASAGTFQLRANQQSWAAADVINIVKVDFAVETLAAT